MSERIRASLLASEDCPAYLNEPKFAHSVEQWAQAEAMVSLIRTWLDGMPLDEALSEITSADEDESRPHPGGVRRTLRQRKRMPAVEALAKWMTKAQSLRRDLGLTPAAYVGLAKDLALTAKAHEDAIERLGRQGQEIRERREAGIRAAAEAEGEAPA